MGWWRKKKKKKEPKSKIESERGGELLEDLIECCDGKSNPIKFFSADDILKATHNFSKSNYVSELNIFPNKWYSGKNENHHKILIKKTLHPYNDYVCRDISISSMVSGHKNFLKLVGCCLEFEDSTLMVYDGVKKHYILSDIAEQLPWKIAKDIATALTYLHTAFPRPFIHRTLSHQCILLDEDGVAKLSDLSFCVSIPKGETFVQVDEIAGTYGYVDDKYLSSGVVSEETDVFAIGVIMQKLLIGHEKFMEILHNGEEEEADGRGRQFQFRLLKFVEERRMDEIADPKMGEIFEEELCRMKAFIRLSQRCTGLRGQVPTMMEVAKELKKI